MLGMGTHRIPSIRFIRLLLLALPIASASPCFGEWTKTIHCLAGRVYRDVHEDAGREEFCELVLPGFLVVKDGPYRSWFSEDHPGATGEYVAGREVGTWKECDRFDRCAQVMHEAVFPEEKKRASFKPEVPVSYQGGKYSFDFASCRSTWVTQTNSIDPINLNISGGSDYRCVIAYFSESILKHGGEGGYVCWVPFAVGVREFDSVDLMREFQKAGLPQFCRPSLSRAEPLMIREGAADVANTIDVQCATISQSADGRSLLTIELNHFASELAKQVEHQQGPLNSLLCSNAIDGPQITVDGTGKTLFSYRLSASPQNANEQESCVRLSFHVLMPCR